METSTYRGIHTSLYNTLPAVAACHLERAIWLKTLGHTKEARSIYHDELAPLDDTPVVVIERADLEQESGRWGEAWRILDRALTLAKESGNDLDKPEYRLMALTRAMLGTRHRGNIVSSADEVARTQCWLRGVPIKDYTDIQASCVRRYVICYLFTKLYSAYDNSAAELIPTCDSNDSWRGLHELRRSLCARGMIHEANAMFRVELNRTPLEDRGPVAQEFLSMIPTISEVRDRGYFEAVVGLQWANTLLMLQDVPRAVEEIDKSEAAFNRFCDVCGITERASTPHMQALEYEKLSCIQNPFEKMSQTESLAGRFEQMESSKTGSCLADAADLANAFFKVTSEPAFQDKYFDFQARLEDYDENVSQDICDLVQHRNSLIAVTLSTSADRQPSLEWIDGFLHRYPHFASPAILALLYRNQALLFRSLRRLDEASEVEKRVVELETCGPSIGAWLHHRSAPFVLPSRDSDVNVARENPDDKEVDEQFFWPWRNSMRGDSIKKETALNLLWEWSIDDVTADRLGAQDFEDMMGIADPHIPVNSLPLTADGIVEIRAHLPVVGQRTPKGQREKRLFCLIMLRDGRQTHFAEREMWDGRIHELQQLLELDRTLPKIIRETFPRNKASWLGAMSMTIVAKLAPLSDFTGDTPSALLLGAEKWNGAALEEHLRANDRIQYAIFLRAGAQIGLMKIFRLQQLMKIQDANTEDIQATTEEMTILQAAGIMKVEEADAILSKSEINASWNDGLDGVTHRQSLGHFYGSAFTSIAAITLHLARDNDISPDTASLVWTWVQKYKARSLARTIGVRSQDPPDLVNGIMQSPETKTLYEEMLDMRERIEKADLMARFKLRRQLDAHLELMKNSHPLLRQLMDLREATPFGISDIANLEAQAGSPIVLVDWFYLPPYIAGQAGKMLLFTARSGTEPTMDIVPVTEADVLDWQKQYLYPSTWRRFREENLATSEARSQFDEKLGGLVSPLAHHTKRGEVLVLCPSSTLHRVPLHALSLPVVGSDGSSTAIDGLIHRNPVVYTHSHSLLRSCAAAAEHARHAPQNLQALFLSGIPEIEALGYGAGRASIRDFARRFDVPPRIDASASKQEFLDNAVKSRLIHLHTHCQWRAGNPLNHHVEFPRVIDRTVPAAEENEEPQPQRHPSPKLEANDEETGGDRPVDRLAARELFDVRLPPSTHVNMIACQGAWPTCSSATSSTVSTLWSIDDADGAEFSRHFFDSFLRQCRKKKKKSKSSPSTQSGVSETEISTSSSNLGFVDIARAVRAAAMKMDATLDEPLYRWAAFVLHGFWQFPLSAVDKESLQTQRR
ncbi:NAD(P)-binding domain protein [Apiospora kogelbergensis]|uniref:NAD(P)-binding domain protein n=1 Tax=Apiospora kogelbergensis TaxID=1337665 RepID=UPI0031328C47